MNTMTTRSTPGSRQPLVQVSDASIGYRGHLVGRGISLALYEDEVLCLLGPNGSGKSTLFKSILGLLPIYDGHIHVQGKALTDWSRRALAQQVAYVPQAHAAFFPFMVEDVVLMGRHARLGALSSPSDADRHLAQQCLEDMGVGHLQRRAYTEISGGERQLVLIARALVQEPAVLVMDEPTASLDFGNQIRVLDHIRALRDRGLGIFLCTHQPEHALRVADRVALFKQGHVHYTGLPQQVVNVSYLAWLYDLDPDVVRANLGGRAKTEAG